MGNLVPDIIIIFITNYVCLIHELLTSVSNVSGFTTMTSLKAVHHNFPVTTTILLIGAEPVAKVTLSESLVSQAPDESRL